MPSSKAGPEERIDQRLPVIGPLVGRLSHADSEVEIDCRPFEVSNGGLGVWTSVPLKPGATLHLRTGDVNPGYESIRLKVSYCLGNHLNTDLFRSGLEAVGTKIDFFGERDGLKIVPTSRDVLSREKGPNRATRTPSSRYMTRTDAALHDARNYLQVAQHAAQIIVMIPEVQPGKDQATFARRILKAVEQLAHCIEDIHQDQQSLHGEAWSLVPVGELLNDAQIMIHGLTEQCGITLTVGQVPPEWCVRGKPKALLRVLMNLLVNAKTAAAGTEDKWIRLEADQTDSHLVIRIADSGRLAGEVKGQLFKKFFSTKPKGARTGGIGLTFVQAVVEHHGGRVLLDENADSTTIVVELPRESPGPWERHDN